MKRQPKQHKLLSVGRDAKTVKGEQVGYLTGILYLAPSTMSGVMDTCTSASDACRDACLFTAGRAGILPAINRARIRKTRELHANRKQFMDRLAREISALVRRASRKGMIPAVRLNGTSDLPWLAHAMAKRFPQVQFYDYTKHPMPWQRTRPNYHLTFSRSEVNWHECERAISHGVNVAVPFAVKRPEDLPSTYQGYRVINGDATDLRFLDPSAKVGVIVGLKAKGRAKHDTRGFTVQLVQIAGAN